MKSVVTIDQEDLTLAAVSLFDLMESDGFRPEGIIGIASGGVRVVEALPSTVPGLRMSCRMQRPSTSTKVKVGADRSLWSRLPYRVSDRLRRLEDLWGERRGVALPPATPTLREDITLIRERVRASGLRSIVVVDDAVDSGGTLACVLSLLGEELGEIDIRSAVITVTRDHARRLVTPDYRLYERTLCRFPWSFDYRDVR